LRRVGDWDLRPFALIATAKTERFRELLGHALNDGEKLHDQVPPTPLPVIQAWGQQAHDLIQAGYGPGEARLFLGEWDLDTQYVTGKEPEGHLWLARRLMRLSRLMDRMHLMQVGPGTKLPPWANLSTKVPGKRLRLSVVPRDSHAARQKNDIFSAVAVASRHYQGSQGNEPLSTTCLRLSHPNKDIPKG
jgi:hypothetical protein